MKKYFRIVIGIIILALIIFIFMKTINKSDKNNADDSNRVSKQSDKKSSENQKDNISKTSEEKFERYINTEEPTFSIELYDNYAMFTTAGSATKFILDKKKSAMISDNEEAATYNYDISGDTLTLTRESDIMRFNKEK